MYPFIRYHTKEHRACAKSGCVPRTPNCSRAQYAGYLAIDLLSESFTRNLNRFKTHQFIRDFTIYNSSKLFHNFYDEFTLIIEYFTSSEKLSQNVEIDFLLHHFPFFISCLVRFCALQIINQSLLDKHICHHSLPNVNIIFDIKFLYLFHISNITSIL